MNMAADILVAACVAALASLAACRAMIAAGVTDRPDIARKMHRDPTPTSGGLGLALGFLLGVCALALPGVRAWSADAAPGAIWRVLFAVIGAVLFLAVGFFDDVRPLRAAPKFGLFALAALAAPLLVGGPHAIALGAHLVLPLPMIAAVLGAALFVFVMVNAVNFLDGANGLAIGGVAIGLVGLAIVAFTQGAPHAGALALCGAAASLGFLVWNFPSGGLFAGDAGALFLGALAASTSLVAIEDGGVSPFTIVLLFFPFLADALLTLHWRLMRGRRLLDGHRDHHYQIGLRAEWPHARVTRLFWLACAVCAAASVFGSLAARGAILPIGWRGGALEDALTYAPFALFCAAVITSLAISRRIRGYAADHGHDGE